MHTSSAVLDVMDSRATIGVVRLYVGNLDRSLQFYAGILGFRILWRDAGRAAVGAADGRALIELAERPGALPSPLTATGLYHLAVLVPSRADLGRLLAILANAEIQIGHSDHTVSEALYLNDPDGNGIELYRDRGRDEWQWSGGQVQMAIDPLDLQGLLAEGGADPRSWTGLPAGTVIGHIHLQVGDLTEAERFYHNVLGFDVTYRMPGALFVSAGGYHHHLGLNMWRSRGRGPSPAGSAGLEAFEIAMPTVDALSAVANRLEQLGVTAARAADGAILMQDPWGNAVHVVLQP